MPDNNELEQQLRLARQQLASAERRLADAYEQIATMRKSLSWRITALLRVLGRMR